MYAGNRCERPAPLECGDVAPLNRADAARGLKRHGHRLAASSRRNRFALAALGVLGPLFLLATFAPLIASNQPLVYHEGRQTLYPWFRAIFNPEETVDLVFNMVMLGFFPWLIAAAGLNLD